MSGIPRRVGGHTWSGRAGPRPPAGGPSVCPWSVCVGTRVPGRHPGGYVVAMRVTHLGHACLLVELADTRILVDPGSFSTGFESLRDLDAVVVTHQHADHLDEERLPDLLAFNRQAPVFADPDSAELLDGTSSDVVVLAEGDEHRIGPRRSGPSGSSTR